MLRAGKGQRLGKKTGSLRRVTGFALDDNKTYGQYSLWICRIAATDFQRWGFIQIPSFRREYSVRWTELYRVS